MDEHLIEELKDNGQMNEIKLVLKVGSKEFVVVGEFEGFDLDDPDTVEMIVEQIKLTQVEAGIARPI